MHPQDSQVAAHLPVYIHSCIGGGGVDCVAGKHGHPAGPQAAKQRGAVCHQGVGADELASRTAQSLTGCGDLLACPGLETWSRQAAGQPRGRVGWEDSAV